MLAHLEDSVGKVLAQIRESGVEDNTLVVFLSDNGGPHHDGTTPGPIYLQGDHTSVANRNIALHRIKP